MFFFVDREFSKESHFFVSRHHMFSNNLWIYQKGIANAHNLYKESASRWFICGSGCCVCICSENPRSWQHVVEAPQTMDSLSTKVGLCSFPREMERLEHRHHWPFDAAGSFGAIFRHGMGTCVPLFMGLWITSLMPDFFSITITIQNDQSPNCLLCQASILTGAIIQPVLSPNSFRRVFWFLFSTPWLFRCQIWCFFCFGALLLCSWCVESSLVGVTGASTKSWPSTMNHRTAIIRKHLPLVTNDSSWANLLNCHGGVTNSWYRWNLLDPLRSGAPILGSARTWWEGTLPDRMDCGLGLAECCRFSWLLKPQNSECKFAMVHALAMFAQCYQVC